MGLEHNAMAQLVSAELLRGLRSGNAPWATPRLTNQCTLWPGIVDWPRPDITFEDRTSGATLALEFKPPNQPKREYVTGLGQMLTYLDTFEYAGLVLPQKAADGFDIAGYLARVVASELQDRPIVLMSYGKSVSELTIHRDLTLRTGKRPKPPSRRGRGTFWAYWRDTSNYDLLTLLQIIDANPQRTFVVNHSEFWANFMMGGAAKTWEGKVRKRKAGAKEPPERLNAFYALRHCGLIDPDGHITLAGLELLHVGKVYGPDSDAFLNLLARRVLLDGNHLDLILWLEELTQTIASQNKMTAPDYLNAIDARLEQEGVIRPRPAGHGKPHFFRDEAKLWNKLHLLHMRTKNEYFFPGQGYRFNWRAIVSATQTPDAA